MPIKIEDFECGWISVSDGTGLVWEGYVESRREFQRFIKRLTGAWPSVGDECGK